MYRIAEVLLELAIKLGVQFQFESQIDEILVDKGETKGVRIGSTIFDSDIVVANSDASETIVNLISNEHISRRKKEKTSRIEPSCSGFVLLLGIDKQYEQLVHHNIFFTKNYKHEFHQIFEEKVMPDDPTIYIANTSYSNPSHAPEGCSNLFILVNAPYLSNNYSWKANTNKYETKIINELEQRGLSGLSKHITVSTNDYS